MTATTWKHGEGKWIRAVSNDDGASFEEITDVELLVFEKEQHLNLRGVGGQERLNMLVIARTPEALPKEQMPSLENRVLQMGKRCVVWITGDTEDGAAIKTADDAFPVIEEMFKLGQQRNDQLNKLKLDLTLALKAASYQPMETISGKASD